MSSIQFNSHLAALHPYVAKPVEPDKIILYTNENPLGMSPVAWDALLGAKSRVSSYPCNQSYNLRDVLAGHYAITPEQIIMGNGSDEIFTLIASTIIGQDDEMVTAAHTFSEYAFATQQFGGRPVYVAMKNGTFSVSALLDAVTPRTKWICLCNPNNPTGTYLTYEILAALLEKIPAHIVVLLDEAYAEYAEAADFPDSVTLLARYPNLIITRTFSKIYGLAGLRVGYGMADPFFILQMNKMRAPFNVNSLGQVAAAAAVNDNLFIEQSRRNTREGKMFYYSECKRMGLDYFPTEANFILVHLPVTGTEVAAQLAEQGVLVRQTASFGLEHAIRITIGTPSQNRMVVAGLEKILTT